MTFRTRLFLTFLLAGIVPIIVLSFIVRNEMTSVLKEQYSEQVAELVTVIEQDLSVKNQTIAESLFELSEQILDDNRLRRVLVDGDMRDRRYLLDYASKQMTVAGLTLLQLQDANGRILSSGHFRNEYDRIEKELPALLAQQMNSDARATMIEARSPEGSFTALARIVSLNLGGEAFTLTGGIRIDTSFVSGLQKTSDITIEINLKEEKTGNERNEAGDAGFIVGEVEIPFIDANRNLISNASFIVFHNQAGLATLQANVDRWFIIVGVLASMLAILVLTWVSSRISRPLIELANKTAKLDLDKLDINFRSDRKDEIGSLSRLLGKMTERLRKSTSLIKDAERRAAIGDLARQVNHDIKNGLTPIKNVFRHLTQLLDSNPQEIPEVFDERKETLNSSIDYLQELAANYARISPATEKTACDVNNIIIQLARDVRSLNRAGIKTQLSKRALVQCDPIALRRIIENLVDNAIDSFEAKRGKVELTTQQFQGRDGRRMIRLVVADNGAGMTKEQTELIFKDFYTTKEKGTGLGLSIVRRLIMDLDGSIRVESEPNKGTTFTIELPESTTKH